MSVAAKLDSNATGAMTKLTGAAARLVDLSVPMKVAAADMAKVMSDAQRAALRHIGAQ